MSEELKNLWISSADQKLSESAELGTTSTVTWTQVVFSAVFIVDP